MDLKSSDPFPELLEPEDFREMFANTNFTLIRKFFILYLPEVVLNLLCNT